MRYIVEIAIEAKDDNEAGLIAESMTGTHEVQGFYVDQFQGITHCPKDGAALVRIDETGDIWEGTCPTCMTTFNWDDEGWWPA